MYEVDKFIEYISCTKHCLEEHRTNPTRPKVEIQVVNMWKAQNILSV